MEQVPRMDYKVQVPLRPFVEKLKSQQQKKTKNPQVCHPDKKKKTPQTQNSTKTTAGKVALDPQSTNQKKRKTDAAGPVKPKPPGLTTVSQVSVVNNKEPLLAADPLRLVLVGLTRTSTVD
ncbi:uncharacterized protein AKAME5_002137400 [Lates japonicus]|uniref:Uncharacterized protein n=1 Tax=Lates japonicus TaxID=270547 RepID=A0AAD3NDZ2_LATJO|nr:uncharacterized protein AKAME5_002137400 [Lates japonicus]